MNDRPFLVPVVVSTAATFRQSAADDGPAVASLLPGEALLAGGNSGGFVLVKRGESVGFVPLSALGSFDSTPDPGWSTQVTAKVLNVRAGPSTTTAIRGTLANGESFAVHGARGGWLALTFRGERGFVSAAYTASAPAPAERCAPADIAAERARIERILDPQARGDQFEALQRLPEYRSQRDNQATLGGQRIETPGGNMCNLTSLAMALSYLGIDNPGPASQFEDSLEHLRQQKGLPPRTQAAGWGGVAKALGATCDFLGASVAEGQPWWEAKVRPSLRRGSAVMMSIDGHIVRLQAVTPAGLVVDDPYGRCRLAPGGKHAWTWEAKNGYDKPDQVAGKNVVWPWANVQVHQMLWIAALSLREESRGLGGGTEDAPLPDFDDDSAADPTAVD